MATEANKGNNDGCDEIDNYNLKGGYAAANEHEERATNPYGSNNPGGIGIFYEKHKFFKHAVPPVFLTL